MKTRLVRVGVACGIGTLVSLFSSCHDYGIVLQPVEGKHHNKIEDNWARIQTELNKYPGLYYVEKYDQGRRIRSTPQEPSGKLPRTFLVVNLDEVHTAAANNKFTGHTVQVGVGAKAFYDVDEFNPLPHLLPKPDGVRPRSTPIPLKVTMPQAQHPNFATESKDMVEKVKEIVEPHH
ncbi:MAG: hypothetical protein ABIU29_07625 [Chthoniobacterales bacterium]